MRGVDGGGRTECTTVQGEPEMRRGGAVWAWWVGWKGTRTGSVGKPLSLLHFRLSRSAAGASIV